MAEYRFFAGPAGKLAEVPVHGPCISDAETFIKAARIATDETDAEGWQGARFVCQVPANDVPTSRVGNGRIAGNNRLEHGDQVRDHGRNGLSRETAAVAAVQSATAPFAGRATSTPEPAGYLSIAVAMADKQGPSAFPIASGSGRH